MPVDGSPLPNIEIVDCYTCWIASRSRCKKFPELVGVFVALRQKNRTGFRSGERLVLVGSSVLQLGGGP